MSVVQSPTFSRNDFYGLTVQNGPFAPTGTDIKKDREMTNNGFYQKAVDDYSVVGSPFVSPYQFRQKMLKLKNIPQDELWKRFLNLKQLKTNIATQTTEKFFNTAENLLDNYERVVDENSTLYHTATSRASENSIYTTTSSEHSRWLAQMRDWLNRFREDNMPTLLTPSSTYSFPEIETPGSSVSLLSPTGSFYTARTGSSSGSGSEFERWLNEFQKHLEEEREFAKIKWPTVPSASSDEMELRTILREGLQDLENFNEELKNMKQEPAPGVWDPYNLKTIGYAISNLTSPTASEKQQLMDIVSSTSPSIVSEILSTDSANMDDNTLSRLLRKYVQGVQQDVVSSPIPNGFTGENVEDIEMGEPSPTQIEPLRIDTRRPSESPKFNPSLFQNFNNNNNFNEVEKKYNFGGQDFKNMPGRKKMERLNKPRKKITKKPSTIASTIASKIDTRRNPTRKAQKPPIVESPGSGGPSSGSSYVP